MSNDELLKLGYKVRFARDKKGLTQEQLAELSEISDTTIKLLERGKCNITVLNLLKIAEILDLNLGIINNKEI